MDWITELDYLQSIQNDGRGVSCVRTIVMFLRCNDEESAVATMFNEWDKLRNYPDVVKFLVGHIQKVGYCEKHQYIFENDRECLHCRLNIV